MIRFGNWLLLASLSANAQQPAPAKPTATTGKVYTYVEQMPELPGGGGTQAISMALMKRFSYPAFNHSNQWPESNVRIAFVVNTDGSLQDINLLASSHNTTIDNALLAAVYAMPCLLPGYQNGQPVRVQLIFPIILEYR